MTRWSARGVLLTFSVVWFVVAAMTIGPTIDDTATTTYGALLVPAVVALAVAGLLAQRRSWTSFLAWVLVLLLGFVNLLAMLTIGVVFMPGTGALVIACALPGRRWVDPEGQYQP